jgi:hypothetical protein
MEKILMRKLAASRKGVLCSHRKKGPRVSRRLGSMRRLLHFTRKFALLRHKGNRTYQVYLALLQ